MTDDADWLRAREEIAAETCARFFCAGQCSSTPEGKCTRVRYYADFADAILPFLRAATRDDVVRELAGDAIKDQLAEAGLIWADNLERGISDREGFAGDFARRILEERAAAHVQGYERAREEIASWVSDADPALADRIKERFKP